MKKVILLSILVALLAAPFSAWGAEIKIAWDANTEADLAGYNVYYGSAARTGTDPKVCSTCGYATKVQVGKVTTYTITGLTLGTTYWISVTAVDTSANESAFSNQVSGAAKDYAPPADPTNLRIIQ